MSNPAVAKWLEEIAAIKAKAQAKEQQQQQEQKQKQEQQQHSIESNKERQDRNPQQPSSSIGKTTATATTAQYGIIPSFNLRTRKKQLRLVLPPEPRKPGPGECCGNDCEPCVNTIYWEDLEAHRNKYRELQRQFEEECRHLESEESVSTDKAVIGTDGHRELQVNEEEDVEGEGDDGAEMSIRSYRPFVVLLKEYLSENTLLVVCDLPYSSQKKKRRNSRPSRTRTNQETMFHVLIRFQQQEDGQFLTRAFTPIDLSRIHTPKVEAKVARGASGRGSSSVGEGLKYRTVEEIGRGFEDRMAFLVKLYPSPHATSDMFRALEVYTKSDNHTKNSALFLRGPIQTRHDRQQNQQQTGSQNNSSSSNSLRMDAATMTTGLQALHKRKRIVMIAAGSGITPMYQVLRALHDQQHQHQQHTSSERGGVEEEGNGQLSFWDADEVDLVYCNRTTDDIWLRQELQFFESASDKAREQLDDGMTAPTIPDMASLSLLKRTVVRVQHVLSSPSSSPTYQPANDQDGHRHHSTQHRYHTGRITLDLLRDTLHLSPSSSSSAIEKDDNDNNNGEQLQILVCGPPLFNKDVSTMLTLLGYIDSASCEIYILE